MIVITAGNKYLDIDAYASGIAYEKLLNSIGKEAVFVSSAKTNMSVSPLIIDLGFQYKENYTIQSNDEFIVLDLSNPEFFDQIVNKNKIIEIIDHHTGFESYWKQLNIDNHIEFIGSVATIIYEKIIAYGKTELLDDKLCKLLISAILDNTLNLKANITNERDVTAYKMLKKYGKVPETFREEYFNSCETAIKENIIEAIEKDIKKEEVSSLLPNIFGQLTIYNKDIVFDNIKQINSVMNKKFKDWIINVICIKDGKSYIICSNKTINKNLQKLFSIKTTDLLITLDKFKLRKEIMKEARNFEKE